MISKKKKVLHRNCDWFFGQNRKFERFFRPKTGDLKKKRVFTKIETDFLARIGNSNVFSAQKQVISKKKKKPSPPLATLLPVQASLYRYDEWMVQDINDKNLTEVNLVR